MPRMFNEAASFTSYGRSFVMSPERMSWDNCNQRYCPSRGGTVACIRSDAENAAALAVVDAHINSTSETATDLVAAWIGLRPDMNASGQYVWPAACFSNYTDNFQQNEPNGQPNSTGACVELYATAAPDKDAGAWNDDSCSLGLQCLCSVTDLSGWDVSSVTDMARLFAGATSFDGDLGTWDVGTVANMEELFETATSFNGDLSGWDVSSVANLVGTFADATSFNSDLGGWDVSSAATMTAMFAGATSFNGDVSSWDVARVTDMTEKFSYASSFEGDVSDWDVSSAVNMQRMFQFATSFNSDLSGWDVGRVTDMTYTFQNATSFNSDLTDWNINADTSFDDMFANAISFEGECSPRRLRSRQNLPPGWPFCTTVCSPCPITLAPTASPTRPTRSPTTTLSPTMSPITPASETIRVATASLSANITGLTAALANVSATEPEGVAEVLAVAADSVSEWVTEITEAASGPSGEAVPERLEAFGQAQEMLSDLTLLAAAYLNTSIVSQGVSADGAVVLTSVHATLDTDQLSYPFFAPEFTGAAACLESELSKTTALSPCLVQRAGAGGGGDGDGVYGDRNTMTLPTPRDMGLTVGPAHIAFVEIAPPFTSVLSKVLSATVLGVEHNTDFDSGATVRFNLTAITENARWDDDPCRFWDTQNLTWSSRNCLLLGTVGGSVANCECGHLTSFAILADANTASDRGLSEDEQNTLTGFVFVCVGISIGCLTVVILVYAIVSELRSEAKVILLHLCIVYDLALILFLATATNNFDDDGCVVVGAALHFFLLSTFLWMLAEGRYLHQTFVNVFSQRRAQGGRQIAVYCSVAYGAPAVEVLLVVLLWPAAYERDDGLCFLSKQNGAIWFFLAPALAVVCFNIFVLVQVSREVWNLGILDQSDSRTAEIITKTKRAFKSSLAFGSILGITWIFGLLSLVVPDSVAFHYIFAFFNALGGLWIFGFHLLKDPEVRKRARTSNLAAMLGPVNGQKKAQKKAVAVIRRKRGSVKFNAGWSGTGTGTDGSNDGSRQADSRFSPFSVGTAEANLVARDSESSLDAIESTLPPEAVLDVDARNGYADFRLEVQGDNAVIRPSGNRSAPGLSKLPMAQQAVNQALQNSMFQVLDPAASTKPPLKLQKGTSEGTYSAGSVRTEEHDYFVGSTLKEYDDDNHSLASAPDEENDGTLVSAPGENDRSQGSAPEENASSIMGLAANENHSGSPPRKLTEADNAARARVSTLTRPLPVYVPPPSESVGLDPKSATMTTLWDPAEAASAAEAIHQHNAALDTIGSTEAPGTPKSATLTTLWDPEEAASAADAIRHYNATLDRMSEIHTY
jgi:surface protein